MARFRQRGEPRASFTYDTTEDGIVCIYDEGSIGRSVTNDIENVLEDISAEENRSLAGSKVIYQDSSGCWDQVLINSRGGFGQFVSINKYTVEDALAVVRERE